MCGIAGIFRFDGFPAPAAGELREPLDRLHHRGPDGRGVLARDRVVLGNRRLAVIDREGGAQPMTTSDGRLALTYNGEIHDHEEHRDRLAARGVAFRGRSDTEVLLALLQREGTEGLNRLSGMFALGLHDREERSLTLARDRFGIKPLLYREEPGGLRFASEAAALAGGSPRLDVEALLFRLAFQVPLGDETLLRGVKSLPPGSLLHAKADGTVSLRRWCPPPPAPEEGRTEAEWEEELAAALARAVRIALRADVPLGVTLSGGLDSSLVTALAAGESEAPVTAFTGYFEEGPAYDERRHARAVADALGVRLVPVPVRPEDLPARLPELAVALEGPVAGPGSLPQLVVADRAREEVTVLLTGQGADELFGGYARMRIAWLAGAGRLDPGALPPDLHAYRPLVRYLREGGEARTLADRYFRLVYRGAGLEDLLGDALAEAWRDFDARAAFSGVFPGRGDPFHRMTGYETRVLLPALLAVEDRVTMRRSLESRVPLLDPTVAALAARIPARIAFGEGEPKRILRRAAARFAPAAAVARQDKMGFPVPLRRWARGPLRGELRRRLREGPLVPEGILKEDAVERLVSRAGGHGRHLWFFLLLSEWMAATGVRR